MKTLLMTVLAGVTAVPLLAAEPVMSPQAFEAYTTGKTLFYGRRGQSYGAERYLPNRRVIWSFLDGECKDGSWFPEGDNICFVYDDNPTNPQCWTFTQGPSGLIAQFQSGAAGEPLYEAQDLNEEMVCMGPDTGV